jgi:hypothetical protein
MSKKIVLVVTTLVVVAGIGVGAFFIIKNISEEHHKKDIEMAADCARTFDASATKFSSMWNSEMPDYNAISQRRREKRQECAEKYHVTHQEIIDKIGTDNYQPV